jgi:hypothetical protein
MTQVIPKFANLKVSLTLYLVNIKQAVRRPRKTQLRRDRSRRAGVRPEGF